MPLRRQRPSFPNAGRRPLGLHKRPRTRLRSCDCRNAPKPPELQSFPTRIGESATICWHSRAIRTSARSARRDSVSNSATPRRIGLIGLGLMGRPMGMNLLKAGHKLTVWNRTASRAQELAAAGASVATTPRETAAEAEILLTMVSDPPALEEVLWGHEGINDGALGGLRAGSIYIDSSTVS